MKKYTANYSQLSKIILEMSEDQQAAMLKMAKKILSGRRNGEYHLKKDNIYWLVSLSILSGWILSTAVVVIFS
jgi:hypothetical protein